MKMKWTKGTRTVIGHFSHDGIGWKTPVKFVISHWSVSIRLLLVKLLALRSVYSYRIYSNKRRPRISATFGTKMLISAALE